MYNSNDEKYQIHKHTLSDHHDQRLTLVLTGGELHPTQHRTCIVHCMKRFEVKQSRTGHVNKGSTYRCIEKHSQSENNNAGLTRKLK